MAGVRAVNDHMMVRRMASLVRRVSAVSVALKARTRSLARAPVSHATGGHGITAWRILQNSKGRFAPQRSGSAISNSASAGTIAVVYAAFLATLHTLRDALPQEEVAYVGVHLPALLRGLYYEGWHPSGRTAPRSRTAFIERIQDGVHRDPGIDADQVARAVLALLAARLPPRELEDAKAATPRALHNLWPS